VSYTNRRINHQLNRLKQFIGVGTIGISAAILSFYFEEHFRKHIRYLYENLFAHTISFSQPGKYFYFTNAWYVFSFALFMSLLSYFLIQQTWWQRLRNTVLAFIIFNVFIMLYCYVDGTIKIMQCTTCNNGMRVLKYDDIEYDIIFIWSLVLAILPAAITHIKKKNPGTLQKK
jgi:hypothetical protein